MAKFDVRNLSSPELANRSSALVLGHVDLARAWGFYLLSEDFEKETELKNKLACIMVRGLIDAIEGRSRLYQPFRQEVARRKWPTFVNLLQEGYKAFSVIASLLDRFTREEQIFMFCARSGLVHGWVNAETLDPVNIKYVEGGDIRSATITLEEYRAINQKMLGAPRFHGTHQIDGPLNPLRERFIQEVPAYFNVVERLFQNCMNADYTNALATDLLDDNPENYD